MENRFYKRGFHFIDELKFSTFIQNITDDVILIKNTNTNRCLVYVNVVETYEDNSQFCDDKIYVDILKCVDVENIILLQDAVIDGVEYHLGDILPNKYVENLVNMSSYCSHKVL